jgi:hypothetical protein
VRPKQWKRKIRFGTWNVRRLYRSGSLTLAARELARYKLDLAGAQGVRWDKGGKIRAVDDFILWEKKIINWEQVNLYTTDEYQQLRE